MANAYFVSYFVTRTHQNEHGFTIRDKGMGASVTSLHPLDFVTNINRGGFVPEYDVKNPEGSILKVMLISWNELDEASFSRIGESLNHIEWIL